MNLVTGATGLVGSRLTFDLLSAGKDVLALKRANSDLQFVQRVFEFYDEINGINLFNRIKWCEADLLDLDLLGEAFEGVESVYHTAALVSYDPRDVDQLMEVNFEGTRNIVNLCLAHEIRELCYISSVAALGKPEQGNLISEESLWNKDSNSSVYGLSKHSAELEVWRGISEGLNAVIVNPSIILAASKPNQSSGMLLEVLRKGSAFYPSGITGYVDVRDVSRIAIMLIEKQIFGQRFICNSENVAFKDMLLMASDIFGGKKPQHKISSWVLNMAAIITTVMSFFTGKPRKITFETARGASSQKHYDNSKIKEVLNYEFTSVRSSLEYYRGFLR